MTKDIDDILNAIMEELDEFLSPTFTAEDKKCTECAKHLHDDILQIIDKYKER